MVGSGKVNDTLLLESSGLADQSLMNYLNEIDPKQRSSTSLLRRSSVETAEFIHD